MAREILVAARDWKLLECTLMTFDIHDPRFGVYITYRCISTYPIDPLHMILTHLHTLVPPSLEKAADTTVDKGPFLSFLPFSIPLAPSKSHSHLGILSTATANHL